MRFDARGICLALLATGLLGISTTALGAVSAPRFKWAPRLRPRCEEPAKFYSAAHLPGIRACCATIPGLCPGGATCPVSGVCPDPEPIACDPNPAPTRRNVILMAADDLADCHYGMSGECRSLRSSTAIPAPVTPNLDMLAGYGTVFPVAHNSAGWCFPSLNTILTGRLQRSLVPGADSGDHNTIPASLRILGGDPAALPDPYDPDNKIGGYCTLLAGKLLPGTGDDGFDARTRTSGRTLGRMACVAGAPGQAPQCGSDMTATYDPFAVASMNDIFYWLDLLLYQVPGSSPVTYRMQNFFVWHAPRIPHQPLHAPAPIREHLFGGAATYPYGGLFDLGTYCPGGVCPPFVDRMATEIDFGNAFDFYASVWWMDDNVRELRKFLASMSAPHCIDAKGRSRFEFTNEITCNGGGGVWANIEPDLPRTTPIVYLADNGWHLPDSKHRWTENGHRTRVIVFDPTAVPAVPDWDPEVAGAAPAAQESAGLAHAADVFPTVVGLALDSPAPQACPLGKNDGLPCNGKDLRPFLATAPGGPQAPENLRRALCGHETQRPDAPTSNRYLLTREGTVGRCVNLAGAACVASADCAVNEACLGGHCMGSLEPICVDDVNCTTGAKCLGGRCRVAPACIDDADCAHLFGAGSYTCTAHATRWCRNAPAVSCSTASDCPACPTSGGRAVPCSRLCEPRRLKFYARTANELPPKMKAVDLFLDPDETHVHQGTPGTLAADMSVIGGPYGTAIRKANCCLDDWWPELAAEGTHCEPGDTCPATLVCD